MRRAAFTLTLMACVLTQQAGFAGNETQPADWPQFRGWRASGVAVGDVPPLQWDATTMDGVAWKVAIPGLGHASPIVSGDFVFVLTAVSDNDNNELRVGLYGDIEPVNDESPQSWQLLCLSRRSGQVFWNKTVHRGIPKIKRHTKATHANSTPAADGTHVIAFLGSEGLHCYDYLGRLKWKKDFGTLDSGYYVVPDAQWGFASSPIIHRGYVIVQCDVQKDSFVAVLDVKTGAEIWRTKREEVPTWSTPNVYANGGREFLVLNGYKQSAGYELATGKETWRLAGGGDIPVPTPVFSNDLMILSSAHGSSRPLRAIRTNAAGNLEAIESVEKDKPASSAGPIAWSQPRDGIYMQTPLVVGDYLYACKDNGVLSCYRVNSGELVYRERLGTGKDGFTASAVAAGDRIYFTCEDGRVFVVRAGPKFDLLATNDLHEVTLATPAIANGLLLVRTKTHLFAIGPRPPAAPRLESCGAPPSCAVQKH